MRTAASPIACVITCQPRLSSIATTLFSCSGVKRASPLIAGRFAYGSSIAAVCDSITPSAISLIAPVLSSGSSANRVRTCSSSSRLGFGERGIGAQRLVDAQRQLAALAQAIEEFEIGSRAAGVLHAGDADAVRFVDRGADRGDAILFGGLWRRGAHQRHGGFLQRAGRFAGARILHDDAVRGRLRAARDAGELQCLRVRPAGVTVVGDQDTRGDPGTSASSICRVGIAPLNGW